jgi:hypothetical protein
MSATGTCWTGCPKNSASASSWRPWSPRRPQLRRLAGEYLPITFGRRHGDPSRPWNQFAIRLKDEYGNDLLSYEGNWRDIFQNWEALALSFPGSSAT